MTYAALAIAVVTAVCAALTYRLVTVDRHEIDLLRQRADKTDDRTAQLRTDIAAATEWAWQHHDAHGWGEEPAEPVHPATQAIPVVTARPSPEPRQAPSQAPQSTQGGSGAPESPPSPPAVPQDADRDPTPSARHSSPDRMTRAQARALRDGKTTP